MITGVYSDDMKKSLCILFSLLFFIGSLTGQTVDTIEVFSKKMERDIKNLVILPAGYNRQDTIKYPVLYLLHGVQADHTSWTKVIRKELPDDVTKYNMIIVCPNGENSWYLDSSVNPASQFETYITKELVESIDNKYKTIPSSLARAISGFSMGGYGALRLAILHPGVFGACGSMSGAVDFRPFPKVYKLSSQLGGYATNKKRWDENVIINMTNKLKPKTLSIIIDCGFEDQFLYVNGQLHQSMLNKGIQHEYIVESGGHDRKYWNKAIVKQLQFFFGFFNKSN
ncbi:conserved exported hypothetical protein [uncultured Dysgonomonas sp.]|uniref:Esterase n=2 Tax=uncultured Dysgonomonas sp. TaxID=206096 RepID=A0A212JQN9_9BACT|nr:conserved exported hypothetical protein [uncultured Dysgonomonas sp.]